MGQSAPGDPSSSSVPMGMTHSGPQHGDPISAMRPTVYYPHESVGSSRTNENSPFQIGTDAGEFPGLYKPADPDPQHDTWTKCINCNGRHRTLAAACPKHKEIIKNKGKEMRERSRSRS